MIGERLPFAEKIAIERDTPVFPLEENGWLPAFKGWQEWATTDIDKIRATWSRRDWNIGVLCGNGLLVIDVDDKPGKHGSESLAKLNLDLDEYNTYTVRTPTGGRHLYYRGPNVGNTVGTRLGKDIDVKSLGGFVVGAGSFLPDGVKNAQGGFYRVINDIDYRAAPEVIRLALSGQTPRSPLANVAVVALDTKEAIERATRWLQSQEVQVQGHGCDYATYRAALTLKDFGLSREGAEVLMLDHYRCEPQDGRFVDFIQRKVDNAYRYGRQSIGAENPAHVYEGVYIPPPPKLVVPGAWKWFRHGDDWKGSVEWLYHEALPREGVCVLSAPTQAGKTFVAMELARSLGAGEPFFGIPPEVRGGTIMLIGEAFGSVKQRMGGLGKKPLPISSVYIGGLAAPGAWKELETEVALENNNVIANHSVPVRLLVLDTLSASGILDDENDNVEAAQVLKKMADLSHAMHALFLVLHHPPKTGKGERGAGAIRNNADYVMEVSLPTQGTKRQVEINKSRDGEQRILGNFTMAKREIGKDDKGRAITTMVLSTAEGRVRAAMEPIDEVNTAFMSAFKLALAASAKLIDGAPAVLKTDVRAAFNHHPDTPKNNRGYLQRVWDEALAQAFNAGVMDIITVGKTVYFVRKEIFVDPDPDASGDGR